MVINRLEWQNSSILRIASKEGVEKFIDIDDDFKEINFNVIPLFSEISGCEWKDEYHIFLSRQREMDPVK